MIEVKNLTKRYGQNLALDRVSFKIEEGTIVGFLGPNGAGKSTAMNIITGYLSATSGEVTVSGKNTLEEPNEVKKMIGYLPELPPLYMDMTVKEYLNFMYELKKAKLPREKHLKEICQLVKIENVYNRLIGNLSKGYKQRVGIAQALIGNPPVLILDEPTVGLDPKQIIEIRTLIKNLGRNHTVILSSHILPEVQAVCERIIVINNGRIVADGATDTLAHDLSPDHRLILRAEGPEKEMVHALLNVPGVVDAYSLGEKESGIYELSVESTPDKDIRRDVFALMARKGWPMLALRNTDLTLEDLFLQLTSTDAALVPPQEEEGGEAPSWTPTRIWSWTGTRTWRRKRMRILRKEGKPDESHLQARGALLFQLPCGLCVCGGAGRPVRLLLFPGHAQQLFQLHC